MNTPRYTKILAGLGTIMILLSLYFTPARAAADDTTRVSVVSNGTQEDGYSDKPSISADGRQIALYSGASNVISRDTQGVNDAFVYENEDPVSAITFTISGNAGVAGTTLSFNDGGPQTVTADGLGEYAFAVSYNWSGTITPSLAGYFFTPVSRSYINIQADQISQNYSASNSWYGSAVISSDRSVVAVGRPQIGTQVMTYDGYTGGSTTMYLPMLFKNMWGYDSAFYVQNLDAANAANITLKLYDTDGNLSCTQTDIIPLLSSHGYWLPDLSCLPASWVGGVVVTSDRNIVAVGRPHIGSEITTYNGFSSGSLTMYVPMLFKNMWGYDAALYVQNVDAANTADITLKFYDTNGTLTYTQTDSIPRLSSHGYWLPDLTCLGTSWVGGVVVTSNRNIVAVGRPHLGAAVTTYDGFASGNTNFYVPSLFKNAAGSFDSALYVQNISPSTAAAITLKYFDMSGILTCTQSDSIPLLSSHGYWLPDQTCLGSSWQGSVKVESSQPVVAVGRLHNGGDVASYDGLTGGNTLVYAPMLFKNMWSVYNSTLTLQNTDPSNTANVTVDIYDVNGNLSGVRTYTIPTMGTISYWLPEVPTVNPNGFTFVSMGDSHALTVNFTNTVNQEAILNPNFVIFNGDFENDGVRSSEMNPMITALKNAGLFDRTFLVRGNHDDHVSGSAALWESYLETSPNIRTYPAGVTDFVSLNSSSDNLNYSFIYGNSMFIGLDVPGDADLLTSAELTFLDTRLTYAESRGLVHAFIYFHGPMYCAESTHCTCTSRTDSSCTPSALIPVINKHPIISAFFNGHEHLLGWVHMDNTRLSALTGSFEEFMTSPSGGGSFNMYLFPARMDYVYPDMTQYDSQGFGFVTVSGNSFTFSIYKTGTTAPVWTKTFTKGVH